VIVRGYRGSVRLAVSIVALALVAPACSSGDAADTPAAIPSPAPPTEPTSLPTVEVLGTSLIAPATLTRDLATAPATMLILGDSGMVDLSPALEASFTAAGVDRVVNAAWPGFGLSRTEFAWRDEWRRIIETERPSVVVVMLGGWDLRYLEDHGPRAYGALVAEALGILTAGGARVEWLAMLPGGQSYLPIVNTVYAQLPHWSSSVDFFDAQGPLRSPDGSYLRTVPSPMGDLLVRKPDHWHFCPDGAALVAAAVHAHLNELGWIPPAEVEWMHGAWRERADLYDNPPGACDPVS
jgi:lysophospholipase L1-like esterase